MSERVLRVDDGGQVTPPLMIDSAPSTVSVNVVLAALGGQTYAAYVHWDGDAPSSGVGAIDWSAGMLTQTTAAPGYLETFFATPERLVFGVREERALHLYASVPGMPLSSWARSCDGAMAVAADACGRVVILGGGVATPAGITDGFFAQALAPSGTHLSLSNGVSELAFARAGSGFAVLWIARVGPPLPFDGSSLSFTTLSWQ